MKVIKVLYVCVHNSARSQMAEAFTNTLGREGKYRKDVSIEAESAGFEPGKLNPVVVEVMKEIGIDISNNKTNSVFEFYKEGRLYDYVITVCDESNAEQCPIFPGVTTRKHWSFKDPSALTGTREKIKIETRKIRDQIREAVEKFIHSILSQ
ncbi:MAG: arsenate reductase ArsC [Candidatus Aminicenantes bacterium]